MASTATEPNVPQNFHVAAYHACLEWWRAKIAALKPSKNSIKVLSVANGSPEYDKEILTLLLTKFKSVKYTVVQPSRAHVRLSSDEELKKHLVMDSSDFAEYKTEEKFGLVHCVLWRNQLPDGDAALNKLMALSSSKGSLVVFSNGYGGVFDIKDRLFNHLKPSKPGCATVPQTVVAERFRSKLGVASEQVPSQLNVSFLVNNKPSSFTYRTLSDLFLCDFEAALEARPALTSEVLSDLRAMSVSQDRAKCIVYAPLACTIGYTGDGSVWCDAEAVAAGDSTTMVTDEWWPHGSKGGFFNVGLRNWNALREQWKERPPNFKDPDRPPLINVDEVMEGLSKLCRTYQLPGPMALPDIIDLYIDIWDCE